MRGGFVLSWARSYRLNRKGIMPLIDFILHIDRYLATFTASYGVWAYLILFLIIFCETGLVVLPLLPGDSLLFAAGALAALGSLRLSVVLVVLGAAAILGDSVNYAIGHTIGPKVLQREDSRVFKRAYLDRTRAFFDRYGPLTIVVARFAPIVRTFAPFMAGVGRMHYGRFIAYNVVGGLAWVIAFTMAGFMFGNTEVVKHNFSLVVIAIVALSVLPAVWHAVRSRFAPAPDQSA